MASTAVIERAKKRVTQGAPVKEVALEMGVSTTTVRRWTDPRVNETSTKSSYEWKQRNRKLCRFCNTNMHRHDRNMCRYCAAEQSRIWTPEAIVIAIREFAAKNGRPPCANEWTGKTTGTGYPPLNSVQMRFGTWNEAIKAAGFEPRRPGERLDREIWSKERIIEAIKEHVSTHDALPKAREWERGGYNRPTTGTVINHFGRWNDAIREAGFEPHPRRGGPR